MINWYICIILRITRKKNRFSTKKIRTLDMKIQIQFRKHERKCYQSKQMWEKKFNRKVFERIKKSKWGICCKSMGIKHPWNVSKLARTLCLVETIYNRKIKTHKVVGSGCVWKGISLINACWVSQSVFY